MASFNRFAVLQVDDEMAKSEKGFTKVEKKGRGGKGNTNAAKAQVPANDAGQKKRARRKKSGGSSENPEAKQSSEQQLWEAEQRQETLNDISYEEAMKEAILNSQITFEEEQDARKKSGEPLDAVDGDRGRKGKKKAGGVKKGRHGITISLGELQSAQFTNGRVVIAPPQPQREPSPPALPQRGAKRPETDIFTASEKEAHRLLEAEKRRETLERDIKNLSLQPAASLEEPACEKEPEEEVEEELDAATLKAILADREAKVEQLNARIKVLEEERNELRHYFQISENKTVAQLNEEVEKLTRLNRELNQSLVDTCIKLEQERSRAHELEKSLTAAGRPPRATRASESDW